MDKRREFPNDPSTNEARFRKSSPRKEKFEEKEEGRKSPRRKRLFLFQIIRGNTLRNFVCHGSALCKSVQYNDIYFSANMSKDIISPPLISSPSTRKTNMKLLSSSSPSPFLLVVLLMALVVALATDVVQACRSSSSTSREASDSRRRSDQEAEEEEETTTEFDFEQALRSSSADFYANAPLGDRENGCPAEDVSYRCTFDRVSGWISPSLFVFSLKQLCTYTTTQFADGDPDANTLILNKCQYLSEGDADCLELVRRPHREDPLYCRPCCVSSVPGLVGCGQAAPQARNLRIARLEGSGKITKLLKKPWCFSCTSRSPQIRLSRQHQDGFRLQPEPGDRQAGVRILLLQRQAGRFSGNAAMRAIDTIT